MSGVIQFDLLTGMADIAVTAGANLFVQTAVVLAAGLAVARMLRGRGPSVESLVLRVFLAGAFVCPAASFVAYRAGVSGVVLHIPLAARRHAPLPVTPASPSLRRESAPVRTGTIPDGTSVEQPSAGTSAIHPGSVPSAPSTPAAPFTGTNTPAPSVPPHRHEHSGMAGFPVRAACYIGFAALWMITVLCMLLRLCAHHGYILLIKRYAIPAKDSFLRACADAARDLGVAPPAVFQSPSVRSPFLAGIVRPCVFLPLGGPEHAIDARAVFHHELAHLRRSDTLWNLLRHIATALIPFQPLLWAVSQRIEEMSDYACDDHAAAAGNRGAYARSLVAVAESAMPSPSELTAGVGMISASPLRIRIERILDVSRAITLRISGGMLVLVYSLCLCAVSIAGLVGIRGGKSFAQITRTTDIVSRKSRQMLFAAALVMKELPAVVVETSPPSGNNDTDGTSADASRMPEDEPPQPREESPAITVALPVVPETPVQPVPAAASGTVETQTGPVSASVEPASSSAPGPSTQSPARPSSLRTAAGRPAAYAGAFLRTAAPDARPMPQSRTESPSGTAVAGDLVVAAKNEAAFEGLGAYLDKGKKYPVWSPDGSTIAFTGRDGFGIWTVPASGGEPVLIHDNRGVWGESNMRLGGGHMRTLSYTPDGGSLTFVTQIFTIKKTGTTGAGVVDYTVFGTAPLIQTLDLATGAIRILAIDADDGSWTPDGARFVMKQSSDADDCSRPGPLLVIDANGENARPLGVNGVFPRVTPDGASIVYSAGSALMRISIAGGTPELLTTGADIRNIAVSPDGRRIMFSSRYGETALHAQYRLRFYDVSTRVTGDIAMDDNLSAEMGTWSPDGKLYCFSVTRIAGTVADAIRIAGFGGISLPPAGTPAAVPAVFELVGNYPNPFNPSTTIEYRIPSNGPARLEILNTQGQKVRVLVDGALRAGKHSTVWNGRDDNGRPVSSGVYIARLKIEGKVESRRMTLVK